MDTARRDVFESLPPFDSSVARICAPSKRTFFKSFGDFLTAVQELKDAEQTPGCMDRISTAREHIMAVRQRFYDSSRDTDSDWWQVVENLALLTNELDLFDLSDLAGKCYGLTAAAAMILREIKEGEESGKD